MSAKQSSGGEESWINKEFLLELLQGQDPVNDANRVRIHDFKFETAGGKGGNYLSDLIRVHAQYSKGQNNEIKSANLIIKMELPKRPDDPLEETFQCEVVCYSKVLPKVKKILQSIGDEAELSAECFKVSSDSTPIYFVFDDLVQRDYKNIDRKKGLDFHEMKLAIIKIAKWHAATAHLGLVEPSLMESFHKGFINPDVTGFHCFFADCVKFCAEEATTWPGYEKYGEKLAKIAPFTIPKGCEAYSRTESEFSVINHGDMWINNIMFHFDSNGIADDAVFVDYSMGFYGSPGIDLNYLFFTSGLETTTEEDWDHLMQIYHQELTSCLKKLNFSGKIPSLVEIQIEFLRKGFVGIFFGCSLLALRLLEDTSGAAELSELIGPKPHQVEFRRSLSKTPKFRKIMQNLLKYLDRKGWLDLTI